jgi:carboxypeptidase Taq
MLYAATGPTADASMVCMTSTSNDTLQPLRDRLAAISDLNSAAALLHWDQQTYMPQGGVSLRSEQLSTMSRLAHEMLVSQETGHLLDRAEPQDPETEEHALLRLARRDYDRATRLPARLVAELSRVRSLAQPVWARARAESDWEAFAPQLERVLVLVKESAEYLGYEEHPYDALLDLYEPGTKTSVMRKMFDRLKAELVPMIRKLPSDEDRSRPLYGNFDEEKQEALGGEIISAFGYDWTRGRQDRVVHPFCISLGGPEDVRITTRFEEAWLSPALFATMHEAGHALYEQGVDPAYSRTPLAGGTSMGVHESQSRLWENLIGRSLDFWGHYYPTLQERFPEALGNVDLEFFYRAINEAKPSEIRVEADELTYNLHVLLRFELEIELLDGGLSVAGLPEAWNAKMEEYLDLRPQSAAKGVLQDVHWSAGLLGYFPTYSIGNVLSVQLFEAAVARHPEISGQIGGGEFGTLLGWLRETIHRHGSRYDPEDLIERATDSPLDPGPYLRYLKSKFGELYGLD